ncbi:TRAP transporter substrate-binding protein DctP [Pseudomarimonas arenosa]|uniref:TRAP transporter substrate-binding protein DctP n=1 Tax=Pseudomarimonas arenosa TaxID=2774145 RepID=A0AAW3ZJV3_9GAMM|nr:TRAP transporter substrate-binding protein DctP [Pseudomarimonas arenosa]MBD8525302.1 TRAP transporter substrate-binding protein DctP [Pseudomarimonas arenosa]
MTIFSRLLSSSLACLLALAGQAHAAQTLKIATVAPEGSLWMTEMRASAERAEQATEGRVKIKFYPGGVMGNDATVLRKIKLGQLHGGALTGSELGGLSKNAQLYGLPFLFDDPAEIKPIRQQFDQYIRHDLNKAGYAVLSMTGVGFAYLMSSDDVGSREALEGRKIWVPQNDVIAERTFRAGGVSPIPLALPDVFTGLQTGLIDTVANTTSGAIALQWHSKMRRLLDLPLSYILGYVVIDQRAWNKISEADQQATLQAFAQGSDRIESENRRSDASALDALKQLGVQVVQPSESERDRWRTVGREVVDALIAESRLDGEVIGKLRAELQRRRQG